MQDAVRRQLPVLCLPPAWGQVGIFFGEGGRLREKASRSGLRRARAAAWEFALWGLQYMCANKSNFSNPVLYEPGCL